MSMSKKLVHQTVLKNAQYVAKQLTYIPPIAAKHINGQFELLENSMQSRKSTIMGMFCIRPLSSAFNSDTLSRINCATAQECGICGDLDWVYNIAGHDGGRLISNGNSLDAYRLALHYGVSDAVIVGSNTVSKEGINQANYLGYLWQPYYVCQWNQLYSIDNHLEEEIKNQRQAWQSLGYISTTRDYPAQIVFSRSGDCYDSSSDFLAARMFHECHPNGERIEAYIMTSKKGAERIRTRAYRYNLHDRIDDILIVLPSSPSSTGAHADEDPLSMDIASVPNMLYENYDMRLVNHDGGHNVLQAFWQAGALTQLHLTLGCKRSVLDVMREHGHDTFAPVCSYFFNQPAAVSNFPRAIPPEMRVVSAISDSEGEVLLLTFKPDSSLNYSVQ
mmetsp:Transcript_8551/g.14178  ORF Transcript_8551/g.14178 Transcript_8551/m.14178 type:complete len:389 (+) Transcript_8551:109-1275(+)